MILAVSRFRVANGLEQEVRQAFHNRPRLVEDAPGFLGMEVLTDQNDPSVFFLHTRWTDADSFRAWHASDAHHRSHAGIPRGLKLDAAFTQLTLLDDIAPNREDRADASKWREFLADSVLTSPVVCFLAAGLDGTIQACNSRMASLLKISEQQLQGQAVWQRLTDPDAARLRRLIASGPPASGERALLNFVSADDVVHSLECSLQIRSGAFAVLGNESFRDQRELQRAWLR
jgi:heme-degrading monooxygenase HmoA